MRNLFLLSFCIFVGLSCAKSAKENDVPHERESANVEEGGKMAFSISTKSFEPGKRIPDRFTCQGEDVPPDLAWSDPPDGTVEFAVLCDDPDAPSGVWSHWVVYGIPPETRALTVDADIPCRVGKNDFGRERYNGPCPPPGQTHRYFYIVFALDKKVALPDGAPRKRLLKAIDGHIVGRAELYGLFSR